MKRNFSILIIALFIIISPSVHAQKTWGVRAGYQTSGLYSGGSKLPATNAYNSFYVGVYKEKKIVSILDFGIGLEFMQTGATSSINSDKQVLSYLDIPMYLKVKLGPVFGLMGTGLNFKVSESGYTNTTTPGNQKSSGVDVPYFLGVGAKISIFTLEARYEWGLLNINNGIHNQYFQVGAAVSF